jgi:hypothetical protein
VRPKGQRTPLITGRTYPFHPECHYIGRLHNPDPRSGRDGGDALHTSPRVSPTFPSAAFPLVDTSAADGLVITTRNPTIKGDVRSPTRTLPPRAANSQISSAVDAASRLRCRLWATRTPTPGAALLFLPGVIARATHLVRVTHPILRSAKKRTFQYLPHRALVPILRMISRSSPSPVSSCTDPTRGMHHNTETYPSDIII